MPADLTETPDTAGASPRLSSAQIALLARYGARRAVTAGDVLFRDGDSGYDFFVVLRGLVAVVEDLARSQPRVISVSGEGRFLGELSLFGGQPVFLSAVVSQDGEVLQVASAGLEAAFAAAPDLRDLVVRAFLLRRSLLLGLAAE